MKATAKTAAKKTAATRSTAKDVDAYIAALPPDSRAALTKLRKQIKATAPKAVEGLFYGVPAFKLSKWLVCYAGFKEHCSFFPMSVAVMDALKKEIKPFLASKGTLRFTPALPLPAALVKKIVKARLAEISGVKP